MNINNPIETERLILLPGENERDNAAFLQMLRKGGDFRLFCGVDFSESNLMGFDGYLERAIRYAIYQKTAPGEMLGYVGLFNRGESWETEFYIKKTERRNGYCTEALLALCVAAFFGALKIQDEDGKAETLILDEIYATTTVENTAARGLLEKSAFVEPDTGAVWIMQVLFDPETGAQYDNQIVEYVLKRESVQWKEQSCHEQK